jgi:integrase
MVKSRDDGNLRAPAKITLNIAAETWLERAKSGAIHNRSGDPYKPSVLRSYEQCLRLRVLPQYGAHKLADLTRGDLQRLVGEWQAQGLDASTIRNTLLPVRAIYRDADLLTNGEVGNPTVGLRLPAVRGKRERVASVDEASRLLDALPPEDRPLWACAFYAGLRHGEIKALTWEDVDVAGGTITITASWDQQEGRVAPKSKAGRRTVPIIGRLRDFLLDHRLRTERDAGLVFGRSATVPFSSSTVNNRAVRAWKAAGLESIGLHEARHTFASYMIAAGANAKTISTIIGHAGIGITFDRYGHLLPGAEAEAGGLLDAFLERADTSARLKALDENDGLNWPHCDGLKWPHLRPIVA